MSAQLKMDTKQFLELWIKGLSVSDAKSEPFSLEIFANMVAKHFRDAPDNAPYLQENGPESITGMNIYKKVVAKCRTINSALKRDTKKSLPMPKKLGHAGKKKPYQILEGIDGADKFLS
jgi:hypothetical protein